MNNCNTVGEAVFLHDTATYPAPQDDDPLPGLIRLADASPNWAQYVGAPPVDVPVRTPPIADLPPTGNLPAPSPPPEGPPPPPASGGPSVWTILGWVRRGNYAYQGYRLGKATYDDMQWGYNNPEAYMEREALSKGGLENYDAVLPGRLRFCVVKVALLSLR